MTVTSSFQDLAREAFAAAQYNAHAVSALELMEAREPGPVTARALEETKRAAERQAEIHHLLTALAPLERTIRQMIGAPA